MTAFGYQTAPPITARELAEISNANSVARRTPTAAFRSSAIVAGAPGTTKTLKAANGFVITFPEYQSHSGVTPAVYEGLLLSGGPTSSRSVYAFDAHTGAPVWTVNLADDGPSAPACAEGVCAFTTESCSLYVVDAKSGKPLWGKWLGDPLMGAPTISDGRVFASFPVSPGGPARPKRARSALAAFDLRTGEVLWQRWMDDDVISAPEALDGDLNVTTLSGAIFRFNQKTGTPISARLQKRPTLPASSAEPWTNADGAAYLLLRPMMKPGDSHALTLADRTIITRNHDVIGSDLSGKRLWTAGVGATTPPIAAGGEVWVGTLDGRVVELDRETGGVLRSWSVGSAVNAEPLVEEGWIYATTADGLVAVDTGDPALTGWAQWGGSAQRTFVETSGGSGASMDLHVDL